MAASKNSGKICIGVGGWTFAPWRGVFYPEKLAQAKAEAGELSQMGARGA